jgi:lipopolysaccharide export system permease protein
MTDPLGKTLRGYLTRELVARFAGALALFTFVLLTARVVEMVDLVLARGVPIAAMASIFVFALPTFFELTSPVAALMAVMVTFSRLTTDGEMVALRAAGLPWSVIVRPVVRFGMLVAVASLVVAAWVRPWANERIARSVYEIAKKRATATLLPGVFHSGFAGVILYVAEVSAETGDFHGIVVADERIPGEPTTVFAATGSIVADEARQVVGLRLRDGASLTRRGSDESYDLTAFASFDVNLDLAADWRAVAPDPSALPLSVLWTDARVRGPRTLEATIELHRKVTFAVAGLLFALIGAPLGAAGLGGGRGRGIATSIGAALIYYLVFSAAVAVARRGPLATGFALALPNLLFALVALYAFLRLRSDRTLMPDSVSSWMKRAGGRW